MERVGDWILHERIGAGRATETWRAVPVAGGRPVAVRRPIDPGDAAAGERLLREGRVLRRLDHPGIPRCWEVRPGLCPMLVMELLEGRTVAERVSSDGPIDADLAGRIASSGLRALVHLHENGLVHRDLGPRRVFLSNDRRVLIIGLDAVSDSNEPLADERLPPTEADYAAPERLAGSEVDHRSDLYSLAATVYGALAGAPPPPPVSHGEDAVALASHLPDLPVRLLDALTRLLARDPAARPPSARIALAILTGAGVVDRSLRRAPLAGRSAALGAIQGVIDAGGALAIAGEPGSGVGRLASYVLVTARREGLGTVAVRCRSRGAGHGPLARVAAELSRLEPLSAASPPPDSDSGVREWLAAAVAAVSERGRFLILVEDADRGPDDEAVHLGRLAARHPGLAVVLTGQRAPSAPELRPVRLRPLGREETALVVAGMLGTASPPAGLSSLVHRYSGGMPALVVFAMKEMVVRGALWCEGLTEDGEPAWRFDRGAATTTAGGLGTLFREMFRALPPASRAVLELVAVADDAVPVDVVSEIAGCRPDGEEFAVLVREGLVDREAREDGEVLVLSRPALGAMLMADIDPERQREVHAAIAHALAQRSGDAWADDRATWHSVQGSEGEQAPARLLDLGLDLLRRGQPSRALGVLTRAGDLPGASLRTATEIAIARGDALLQTSRVSLASRVLELGLERARDLGDKELVVRAQVALAQAEQERGAHERSMDLAAQAVEQIGEYSEDPSLPRALLVLATGHQMASRPDLAVVELRRCIEVAESGGRREYAAAAHGVLGQLLAEDGQLDEAADHLDREATSLRARVRPEALVHTLWHLARLRRSTGNVRAAIEALEEADEVARLSELPYQRALARIGRGEVLLALGNLESAAAILRASRVALDSDAPAPIRLAWRELLADHRFAAGERQGAIVAHQDAAADATLAAFTGVAAFHRGMAASLTGDRTAASSALAILRTGPDRRLRSRLYLAEGLALGDLGMLRGAYAEARASGDRFLLLDVLLAMGDPRDRMEAREIAWTIHEAMPRDLRGPFRLLPVVRWSGIEEATPR